MFARGPPVGPVFCSAGGILEASDVGILRGGACDVLDLRRTAGDPGKPSGAAGGALVLDCEAGELARCHPLRWEPGGLEFGTAARHEVFLACIHCGSFRYDLRDRTIAAFYPPDTAAAGAG